MGRKKKRIRPSLIPDQLLKCSSYIDTVCVILPERMPAEAFRQLRLALCASLRPQNGRYLWRKVPTADGYWIYKLTIHQPTPESILELGDAVQAINLRLLEVHVALDLMTSSPNDAETLQAYVEGRLLPSSRLKRLVHRVRETTYYNRRTRKGVEVVLYSDRRSKVSGQFCLHVEWRVMGGVALRREGLATAVELLRLNHSLFWDKRLALWLPPSETTLAKARNKMPGAKKIDAVGSLENQGYARRMLRRASGPNGVVVAHDLLQHLRKAEAIYNRRPMRLFVHEPHDWMLPPEENAMWAQ